MDNVSNVSKILIFLLKAGESTIGDIVLNIEVPYEEVEMEVKNNELFIVNGYNVKVDLSKIDLFTNKFKTYIGNAQEILGNKPLKTFIIQSGKVTNGLEISYEATKGESVIVEIL